MDTSQMKSDKPLLIKKEKQKFYEQVNVSVFYINLLTISCHYDLDQLALISTCCMYILTQYLP